jgi:hypothetical protein
MRQLPRDLQAVSDRRIQQTLEWRGYRKRSFLVLVAFSFARRQNRDSCAESPWGVRSRCGGCRVRRIDARLPEQAAGSLEHRLDEAVGSGNVDAFRQDDLFPQGASEDVVNHVGETKMP